MSRMCNVCCDTVATVPDRNVGGRPIKLLCSKCNTARLLGDLEYIVRVTEAARVKRMVANKEGASDVE